MQEKKTEKSHRFFTVTHISNRVHEKSNLGEERNIFY